MSVRQKICPSMSTQNTSLLPDAIYFFLTNPDFHILPFTFVLDFLPPKHKTKEILFWPHIPLPPPSFLAPSPFLLWKKKQSQKKSPPPQKRTMARCHWCVPWFMVHGSCQEKEGDPEYPMRFLTKCQGSGVFDGLTKTAGVWVNSEVVLGKWWEVEGWGW